MEYIVTGKSGPQGKCCCYYYRVRGPLTGQEEVVELYTIGMLREHNRQFVANGSKLKDAQLYDNMIHAPLLTGPDFMLVLDQFLPPQLHLLLRSVNHIVENLQLNSQKLYGTDFVMDFVKKNAIVRQNYHGGGFEGNQCSDILKKVSILESKLPEDLKVYTKCLKSLNIVKKRCFESVAHTNYLASIQDSAVKRSIGFTIGFHNHGEGLY